MTKSRRIGRLFSTVLVCSAVSAICFLAHTAEAQNNLALGQPAFSSSNQEPALAPSNTVDASQFTRWSSAFSDPQWIYVDLGAHQNIDRVRLLWEVSRADDYEIQVSSDATTWTNVFSRASAAPLNDEISFTAVNTRYVRMYGISRVDTAGYSIWEFEVYAVGAAMDELEFVSLAYEKTVTVSSTESPAVPGSNAVDAVGETRWASEHSDPQWIYVDLGAVTTVDEVRIVWEVSRAKNFELQISADAISWTNVYTGTDAGAQSMGSGRYLHDIALYPPVAARYVRMYGTNRVDEFGYSIFEFMVYSNNLPDQPTGLTATPLSGSEMQLSWTDTSDNEDGFKIRRSDDGVEFYTIQPLYPAADATSIVDSNLTADTMYWYMIRSENANGQSPYTDPPASGTTYFVELPAAPTGLVATAVSQTQIDLTWTDVATNEEYYKAYRSPNGVDGWSRIDPDGGLPVDTQSFSDTNCASETIYYYAIRCWNAAGNSQYSTTENATTPAGVPLVPTDIAAEALSTTQIQVTWTDNSSNEEGFELQKSADGVVWTNLPAAFPTTNETSYLDSPLTAGTTRHYRIRAQNGTFGDSAFDGPVNATTPTPVASFTAYNDLAWFTGQINSKITTYTTPGSGWLVDYDTDQLIDVKLTISGGGSPQLVQGVHPAPGTDGDDVFGGKVDCASTISHNDPNDLVLVFSGLSDATTYEVVIHPDRNGTSYTYRKHHATIEDADGFLNDSTPGVTITTVSTANDTTIFSAGYNTNGYVTRFTAIEPGTNGSFTITLRQDAASEYFSYANAIMLKSPSVPPATPTGLVATAVSASQIDLTWTDVATNESGYQVYRSPDGVAGWVRIDGGLPADAQSFNDTTCASETTYYYRVRAYSATGNSDFSNIDSDTTPAAVPLMPSDLAAEALSATEIQLTWTDNSSNEDEFELQRSDDGVVWTNLAAAFPVSNAITYVDTVPPAGARYYQIRANNSVHGHSAFDGPVNATTPSLAPASFTAYNDLAWFAGQTNDKISTYTTPGAGWLVDYATGAAIDAKLTITGGNPPAESQGAHPDPGTDADNVFGGKVDCKSTIVHGGTDLVLAFSGLSIAGTYEVVLYADRNEVLYTDRNQHATIGGADSFVNDSTDGVTITTVSTANDTTIYNAGYNVAAGYVTRFTAVDPGSDGAFTITLRQDTGAHYENYLNAVMLKTPSAPPATPAGLTATAVSISQIDIAWTDVATTETGYAVYRSLDGVSGWTRIDGGLPADSVSFNDTTCLSDTTYYYRTRAYNADGNSYFSNIDSATTPADIPLPPSDLAAEVLSATQIRLTWTDNSSNEDEFELQKSDDGVVWTNLAAAFPAADATTYVDTVPSAGTRHYQIRANHAVNGNSAFDGPVNATTPSLAGDLFTAYNDLSWFAGQTDSNITIYTTTNDEVGVRSGWLMNYDTGNSIDVKLTVSGGGGRQENQGLHPDIGTDADDVFGGKVDCKSTVSYSRPNDLVLTFSGLITTGRYEVVLYPNRANSYTPDRLHHATIGGADSFTNDSTVAAGVTITTVSMANDTTIFSAATNTTAGYVTRFTGVDPGSDGEFTITMLQDPDPAVYHVYVNALMLKGTGSGGGEPPTLTEKIVKGDTWSYAKGTVEPSDPATAWRAVDFNDTGWATGGTPLGYSVAGGMATTLGDMAGSYSTVYLRKTFTVPNPALVNQMIVQVDYEDGFILFINGQEMARVNVAGTPGTFMANTALAASSISVTPWSNTWDKASLPVLLPDQNVVALQVFNDILSSDDLHIDLALAVDENSYLDLADDADANGMGDVWETANFGGGAIATNDADGDGHSNGDEFVAGTPPTNAAGFFAIEPLHEGADVLIRFFAVEASGAGYDGLGLSRYYALEECAALEGNAWSAVPGYGSIPGDNTIVTYTNPAPANMTLYRGRVWLQ